MKIVAGDLFEMTYSCHIWINHDLKGTVSLERGEKLIVIDVSYVFSDNKFVILAKDELFTTSSQWILKNMRRIT